MHTAAPVQEARHGMMRFTRSSSEFCLLLVVLLGPSPKLANCGCVAATSTSITTKQGEAAIDAGAIEYSRRLQRTNSQGGTDLRGGFGERQKHEEYNVDKPLFEFTMLVTGYEPFLHFDGNPAHQVALAVNGTCDMVYLRPPFTFRLCYEGVSVPVNFDGSGWTAESLLEDPATWDGVIHLGLESLAKGLRLETMAANVESSEDFGHMWNADVPCEKEGTPFRYIHEGSPCVLPTTAPLSYLTLEDLTSLLKGSGHEDLVSLETWSRDAGAYYCNDQFYRTLHAIRSGATPGSSLIPAMFVHLPDPAVIGLEDVVVMVKFIAESLMLGTIGLLPKDIGI